ncbi:GATA zinc finger domain-containing protein 10-like [Musca vetustissima]|uniref:GATA zinc finger domain-containing protein 10-like n=1 Tax=Musca vetustissima TaxID=27455 RepID=UPI002AB7137D|nr:GATA zinc finger domain-containing protein 10-like [Musca vetustissima]
MFLHNKALKLHYEVYHPYHLKGLQKTNQQHANPQHATTLNDQQQHQAYFQQPTGTWQQSQEIWQQQAHFQHPTGTWQQPQGLWQQSNQHQQQAYLQQHQNYTHADIGQNPQSFNQHHLQRQIQQKDDESNKKNNMKLVSA